VSLVKIDVDADNMLGRQFSAIERQNLPFAIVQACNATAFEIRETWKRAAPRVFDRPTPMTVRAALYRKATKQKLYAEIFLRDEASKGNAPAKYLQAQVEGGTRRPKGMERLLMSAEIMPRDMFAVAGKGAQLDQYGNVKSGQVRQIISQMRAGLEQGYTSNETDDGKARRLKKQRKRGGGGSYFVVKQRRGRLLPGIYERVTSGFGSAVRSIFIFTKNASYQPRYNIFGLAQRQWNKLMPFHFNRELQKALDTSKYRGRS
jgi:hypothetical protein